MISSRHTILLFLACALGFTFGFEGIYDVSPREVYPGSFITLFHNISTPFSYQSAGIFFDGIEGLIITIDQNPGEILVRVPPVLQFELNPIRLDILTISGYVSYELSQDLANVTYINRTYPSWDIGGHSTPRTFIGGSLPSSTAKKDIDKKGSNSILIINCYLKDREPSSAWWSSTSGKTEAQEKQRQTDSFEILVKKSFNQMSYNQISWSFTYTDYVPLPEDDDYYFYRNSDITAIQNELVNATGTEKEELEEALDIATDRQNAPQRTWDMFYDAIKAADNAGYNVDAYDGIMLNIATGFCRGAAYGTHSSVTEDRDTKRSISLQSNTYLWYISFVSHWGRRVHELAHSIASGDLYGDTGKIATGSVYDMMGSHNNMPLFSGYNMVEKVEWYEPDNILTLSYDLDYPKVESYDVVAHGTSPDSTANSVYNVIKIHVFEGLDYYIQVRQEPSSVAPELDTTGDNLNTLENAIQYMKSVTSDPILFDTRIYNNNEPGQTHKSGILVTKVSNINADDLNQRFRLITVLGKTELLDEVDECVDDPANNLRICPKQLLSSSYPARWRVEIQWTNAVGDPQGLFNLHIRDWDSNYQTNDIWIDSEENGWETYSNSIEPETGNPRGNGDKPWVNKGNRYHAFIWNSGVRDATNVQVTYYTNSPPAIGDNGDWVPHSFRFVDMIQGTQTRVVNPNSNAPIWTPVHGEHTCLRVQISAQSGETNVDDNIAQENVFSFDTSGSSPKTPLLLVTQVKNPRNTTSLMNVVAYNIPRSWEVTIEEASFYLPPLGSKFVRLVAFTDQGRTNPVTTHPEDLNKVFVHEGSCCLPQGECTFVESEKECNELGGGFLRGQKCSERLCGVGACCIPNEREECTEIFRGACIQKKGIFHGPGTSCDKIRCGVCCYYEPVIFRQTQEEQKRCARTSQVECDRLEGTYQIGGYCPCNETDSNLRIGGFVDSWDSPEVISGNVDTEFAEDWSRIGGIMVNLNARKIAEIDDVGIEGNTVTFCIRERTGDSRSPYIIEIRNKEGEVICIERGFHTQCPHKHTLQCELPPGDYFISIIIPKNPNVGRTNTDDILITCFDNNGCRISDVIPCKYDPRTGDCMRKDCPLDPSVQCVKQVPFDGSMPICTCKFPEKECLWDKEKQACTRKDCPYDPNIPCVMKMTDNGPVCGCDEGPCPNAPEAVPLKVDWIPTIDRDQSSVETSLKLLITSPYVKNRLPEKTIIEFNGAKDPDYCNRHVYSLVNCEDHYNIDLEWSRVVKDCGIFVEDDDEEWTYFTGLLDIKVFEELSIKSPSEGGDVSFIREISSQEEFSIRFKKFVSASVTVGVYDIPQISSIIVKANIPQGIDTKKNFEIITLVQQSFTLFNPSSASSDANLPGALREVSTGCEYENGDCKQTWDLEVTPQRACIFEKVTYTLCYSIGCSNNNCPPEENGCFNILVNSDNFCSGVILKSIELTSALKPWDDTFSKEQIGFYQDSQMGLSLTVQEEKGAQVQGLKLTNMVVECSGGFSSTLFPNPPPEINLKPDVCDQFTCANNNLKILVTLHPSYFPILQGDNNLCSARVTAELDLGIGKRQVSAELNFAKDTVSSTQFQVSQKGNENENTPSTAWSIQNSLCFGLLVVVLFFLF